MISLSNGCIRTVHARNRSYLYMSPKNSYVHFLPINTCRLNWPLLLAVFFYPSSFYIHVSTNCRNVVATCFFLTYLKPFASLLLSQVLSHPSKLLECLNVLKQCFQSSPLCIHGRSVQTGIQTSNCFH